MTNVKTIVSGVRASNMRLPFMPQIVFAPEDESGAGADQEAQAAAEAAAAAKAAEDAETKAAKEADEAQKRLDEADNAADASKDAATLAAEKRELLREVMEKKNKLKEVQTAAAEATQRLKEYEGVDVVRYRELIKKEQDAEAAAAEARGDFDRVKAMMAEEHSRNTKSLEDEIAALREQLSSRDKVIDDLTVGNDFGSSRFIKDDLTLTPNKARQLYGSHFAVEDGRTVAYDKPASQPGRTKLVDASGNPLDFDSALSRIIDADPDKATLLRVKLQPGSSSNHSRETVAQKKPEIGSGIDRIRASFEK